MEKTTIAKMTETRAPKYTLAELDWEHACWCVNNGKIPQEAFDQERQRRRGTGIGVDVRQNPSIDHLPQDVLNQWHAFGRISEEQYRAEMQRRYGRRTVVYAPVLPL